AAVRPLPDQQEVDDQLEELVGKGDAAAASPGLDLYFDHAAIMAVGAPAGMAGALRRTWGGTCPLVPLAVLRAWFVLWERAPHACGAAQPCCQGCRYSPFMISKGLLCSWSRDHFRPSASPWRSPSASAMTNRTPLRLCSARVRMRSISSASKGSTSKGGNTGQMPGGRHGCGHGRAAGLSAGSPG